MRLQLTCKAGVRHNREHESVMLMFTFHLGPIEFFCLAHLPREGERESSVFVKVTVKGRTLVDAGDSSIENWTCFGSEVAKLESGDRERVPLGPVLIYVEDGEAKIGLRKRMMIDPRFRSFEDWQEIEDGKGSRRK